MSAVNFLDTNILLYAYDSSSPKKQQIAQLLLTEALGGQCVLSVQVLAEFSAALLHKLSPKMPPQDVTAILDALLPIRTVSPDAHMVQRAVEARAAYGIHFYDGMIVAAAERAGCTRIWSEDFNSGQEYFGVMAESPFSGTTS